MHDARVVTHPERRFHAPSVLTRAAILALTVILPTGCVTLSVVGRFEKNNEVCRGSVVGNLLTGTSRITVSGLVSKVTCSGAAVVTHIPNPRSCVGQAGEARLTCDDGRIIEAEFALISCTRGYGKGHDQNGLTFVFTTGMNDKEAEAYIGRESAAVASFEPLPPPQEVRAKTGFYSGTGFFVSTNGHVVTAYHVVEGGSKLEIVDSDGVTHPGTLLKADIANDLAVIRVDGPSVPLPVADASSIRKGSEVMTLGYPLTAIQGQEQKATFGRVNALSGVADDLRYLQIDVPIQPGNSGGPLISRSGIVVGVISATINQGRVIDQNDAIAQNVNYAVKSDYLIPLLRQAQVPVPVAPEPENNPRSIEDVVRDAEKSVVLVISR